MAGHVPEEVNLEVRRNKTHFFLTCNTATTVNEVKHMLADMTRLSVENMELWKLNDNLQPTELLANDATMQDCGYAGAAIRQFKPPQVGLRMADTDEELVVVNVSAGANCLDDRRS